VARDLGGSFGVSLANTELLQRSQFHQARSAENIVSPSPSFSPSPARWRTPPGGQQAISAT
jgi:hypothetical protein